jgi:hypothetical protein
MNAREQIKNDLFILGYESISNTILFDTWQEAQKVIDCCMWNFQVQIELTRIYYPAEKLGYAIYPIN